MTYKETKMDKFLEYFVLISLILATLIVSIEGLYVGYLAIKALTLYLGQ